MTLVAACRFRNGAVVVADSRATWIAPGSTRNAVEDTLRKILHIAPGISLSYAGSVEVARCVADALRRRAKLGGRSSRIRKMALDLPRIAKHCQSQLKRKMNTGFVLAGTDGADVLLWTAESPTFSTKKINHGFFIMGSGADAVRSALEARFDEMEGSGSLKLQADFLRNLVERQLKQAGENTVGGLFQAITIEVDGIRPITYGFTSMDPESTAPSMSMGFEKGTWVQRVEATGKVVPVGEPASIIQRGRSGIIVQHLELTPEAEKRGMWRLCYLVPCFAGTRDHNAIEFRGEWSSIGVKEFPLEFDATIAIGFWGSPGKHTLEIKLVQGTTTTCLLSLLNDVPHPIEVVDRVARVHLTIKAPGPAFLECFVDGSLLGHKGLFFSEVPSDINPQVPAAMERLRQLQIEEQYRHADPYLDDHVAALSYWSVCRKAHWELRE
jgi:20S proteasome alpha/beta subunit